MTGRVVGLMLSCCALLIAAPIADAAQARPARPSQTLQLVFPLAANTNGLERLATSISTPGSPQYAHYRSLRWLSSRFGASAATRRRVVSYLRRVGSTDVRVDGTGMFADARMTVAVAQRVFGVRLAQVEQGRTRFIAPISASAASVSRHVPAALRGLVRSVVGLDTRPVAKPSVAGVPSGYLNRTGTPAGCAAGQLSGGFTPNQYLTAYDFSPLHAEGVDGQGETVALIEIDGFKDSDINAFAQCFGLAVPTLNAYGVGGISHPLAPGGEATLDLEVLDAAAPFLKQIDVYESSATPANTLIAMTAPLSNRGHHPQVVSVSLGLCEPAVVGAISPGGLDGAEASLAEAAATGITYLAASGDQGSADCSDVNGNPAHQLAVNYPASSWWVTGVGGTNFALNASNQLTGQVVWNDTGLQAGLAGGGGLSGRFVRPNYQNGVVSANRRAVPDVSMLADVLPGYAIFCSAGPPDCAGPGGNPWTTVGGTSAATPLLAGGFALVDQLLQRSGREDLGLVNPLLYSLGRAGAAGVFDDVTVGDNDIYLESGSPLACCGAAPGFDEASGWGSVNIANFSAFALQSVPVAVRVSLSLPGHQHPLSSRELKATVACSAACTAAAYALIKVGAANPFEVDSKIVRLGSAGSAALQIKFGSRAMSKIQAGKRHHKRITATIYGVALDSTVYGVIGVPGESVQAQTGGKKIGL
ncbi:MAG TPA: S53 family peptidase [Solirubrobacteraceae bacterium]|nr:S53 family peptidase [Solirubrobacteraceae bacterium]